MSLSDIFTKKIESEPENAGHYRKRANRRFENGEFASALNDYSKATEMNPKITDYFERGMIYLNTKNYNNAVGDFSKVIDFDSICSHIKIETPLSYLFRSYCHYKMENDENALRDILSFDKNQLVFSIRKIKQKHKNMIREMVEDSSISFMLRAMSLLFDVKYKRSTLDLVMFLDNFNFEQDPPENAQNVIPDIFRYYPKFVGNLPKTLERDGKEFFLINTKMSFLKYIFFLFQNRYNSSKWIISFIFVSLFLLTHYFWGYIAGLSFLIATILFLIRTPLISDQIHATLLYFDLSESFQEKSIELAEKHEQEKSELKTKIFQAISHTISNIMMANKSITRRIKSGTSSVNDVSRLELLNDLVLSTMNAVKLAFSNENIVLSRAQNELFCEKTEDGISLHDLLWFCLNVNLYYLVVGEGEEAWATIRNIFFSINRYDKKDVKEKLAMLKEMRKSPHFSISELSRDQIAGFANAFQSEQFEPVRRFFAIEIEALGNLYVKKNSYTFSVLFIVLLELTKNMIRYGTVEDQAARKFTVKSETEGNYAVLTLANVCRKSRLNLKESTLKGLAMIQEFSKVVGRFEQSEKETENSELIEFAAKLFIKKPGHQNKERM